MNKINRLLINQKYNLSCYESMTGGMLSNTLTNIPGASCWFMGSIITYTVASKIKVGGVSETIIQKYGVISQATADAMAETCQKKFNTNIAIGVTGNAGPTTLDNLPIGTVFVTIVVNDNIYQLALKLSSKKKRIKLKKQVVKIIIQKLSKILKGKA